MISMYYLLNIEQSTNSRLQKTYGSGSQLVVKYWITCNK